jgi:hypothetical protein
MSRIIIYLRQGEHGWGWSRRNDANAWWGFYHSEGHAKAAAKRAFSTIYDKSKLEYFEFVEVKEGEA